MWFHTVIFFVLALPGALLALAGGCPAAEDAQCAKQLNEVLVCGLALLSAGVIVITFT
jgi:hypothetical protein